MSYTSGIDPIEPSAGCDISDDEQPPLFWFTCPRCNYFNQVELTSWQDFINGFETVCQSKTCYNPARQGYLLYVEPMRFNGSCLGEHD